MKEEKNTQQQQQQQQHSEIFHVYQCQYQSQSPVSVCVPMVYVCQVDGYVGRSVLCCGGNRFGDVWFNEYYSCEK